jgi:galactose oxidase-like protein/Kelch motif protein
MVLLQGGCRREAAGEGARRVCRLVGVALSLIAAAFTASPAVAQTWSPAGNMSIPRESEHQVTTLIDGRVLVSGGHSAGSSNGGYNTKLAELWDPSTNLWSTTGSTNTGRVGHTATRLGDGKVILAGGVNANICTSDVTTELYDPATGSWSGSGNLPFATYGHTATLLPNGKVLLVGGGDRCGTVFSGAVLYDPASGAWSSTGNMTTPREFHNAVGLSDGRVLVAGGLGPSPFPALSSAEIYDPATGTWSSTGGMATTRFGGEYLSVLADGRVLGSAGYSGSGFSGSPNGPQAEIFDPATGTWSSTGSMSVGHSGGTFTLLFSDAVLVAGGGETTASRTSAELWDPGSGTWSNTGALGGPRINHADTLLADGRVFVAGGSNAAGPLSSAEVYNPPTTYARPKGATPHRVSLVLAYKACTASNTTHAPPLSHPSCSPPEQASDYLTVGTLDANGQPAKSAGFVRMAVVLDNPATPADEEDIAISGSMTDVRNKAGLSDYTGELQVKVPIRITDKLNGPAQTDGGTVEDFAYSVTMPCTATGDTTVGSTCSMSTTEDSLAPNSVVAGKRAIQRIGQVDIYDGGSDGVAATSGNTAFAWQGLFAP